MVLTDLASVLPYLQKNARFIPSVAAMERESDEKKGEVASSSLPRVLRYPHVVLSLQPYTGGHPVDVRVQEFPWGEPPEQYGLRPPYDLIVAADCIYDVAQVAPFLQSLRSVVEVTVCLLGAPDLPQHTIIASTRTAPLRAPRPPSSLATKNETSRSRPTLCRSSARPLPSSP